MGESDSSSEVIDILNFYLNENASDEDLSGRLLDKIRVLNSAVTIPESLTDVLMAGMNDAYT